LNENKSLFLPARGGVGSFVEHQANTIAAKMAENEKGEYALLHVPDPMSEALYETIIHEPSIAETLNKIKQANIVLHGIGNALEMAKRRQTETETYTKLENSQAIAEALGYYFDQSGEVVHKVKTVGLKLNELSATEYVSTEEEKKKKAQAIESFIKKDKSDVLIIDEAAAIEILQNNNL